MNQVVPLHPLEHPPGARRQLGAGATALAAGPVGLIAQVRTAMEASDIVGSELRSRLQYELTSRVFLRRCSDPLALVGPEGSGRHHVARFVHETAAELLGRRGELVHLFATVERTRSQLDAQLTEGLRRAVDGILVVEGFDTLSGDERATVQRLAGRFPQVMTLVVAAEAPAWPSAAIKLDPLYARGDDLDQLCCHFANEALEACGHVGGLGEEALEVIVGHVRAFWMDSVDQLRHMVRDLVFGAFASADPIAMLSAEQIRVELAGRPTGDQDPRPPEQSHPEIEIDDELIEELAELHDISPRLLAQQCEIAHTLTESISDAPRSFRNIMDRTDVVRRVALWLVSGAGCQADFRRWFGDARFMQPSKSSAWAFYNTVFKRDD